MRIPIRLPVLLVALFASGCSEAGPSAPTAEPAYGVNGAGRLAVYNAGVNRAVPSLPCRLRAEHRQFDFWVGEWNVTNAAGGQAGTNIVQDLLGGCVIQENWTGAGGGRGRSLNAYDPDTGLWHQTWVSAFDTGHLRMGGGLDGGVMAMAGVRTQPNGVEWIDSYTWTPLNPDQLVQAGRLQIPVANIDIQFALTYTRTPGVVPAPESPTAFCQPGGRSALIREADFWLGDWTVRRANGLVLGTAHVTSDLSGCLTVEQFATAKGYGAISYTYYDIVEQRMYRTYIDSEGERMELGGGFVNGMLVLSTTEPGPAGAYEVRMTLEAVTADVVQQRFEVSDDGGASWRTDIELVYERG